MHAFHSEENGSNRHIIQNWKQSVYTDKAFIEIWIRLSDNVIEPGIWCQVKSSAFEKRSEIVFFRWFDWSLCLKDDAIIADRQWSFHFDVSNMNDMDISFD